MHLQGKVGGLSFIAEASRRDERGMYMIWAIWDEGVYAQCQVVSFLSQFLLESRQGVPQPQ